jgi:hypothetical protein
MSISIVEIAKNILEELDRDEVRVLVTVLNYFNRECLEDCRADCLEEGCQNPSRPTLERLCQEALEGKGRRTEKKSLTANAGEIYLSTPQPVCPCCRK